nr:tetraspanin-10 isoform X1 [Microcebus murinus]
MEEGERSPLLPQDSTGQNPPLSVSSPPLPSHPDPAPRQGQAGAWGCSCCPPVSKNGGWTGDPAPPLPAGSTCIKCLTVLSNFLFSLLGLLALATGLWGLAVKGSLGSGWGRPLPADPMLGLVLGGLAVSAVSLAGCVGGLCENTCLLRCYCGSVVAFLMLQAVAAALAAALWGPLQDSLEHALRVAITHYQDDLDLGFLLDQVQLGLQCCGVASYQDWQQNLYFNCSSPGVQACSLPASCCIDPREDGASINDQCGFGALGLDADAAGRVVYLEGCGPPLRRWLRGQIPAVGASVIVATVVQGAELLLATWLIRALAVRKTQGESAAQKIMDSRPRKGGPAQVCTGRTSWQLELSFITRTVISGLDESRGNPSSPLETDGRRWISTRSWGPAQCQAFHTCSTSACAENERGQGLHQGGGVGKLGATPSWLSPPPGFAPGRGLPCCNGQGQWLLQGHLTLHGLRGFATAVKFQNKVSFVDPLGWDVYTHTHACTCKHTSTQEIQKKYKNPSVYLHILEQHRKPLSTSLFLR